MFKKLLVIPLFFSLLTACNKPEAVTATETPKVALNNYSPADGYFFEQFQFTKTNMAISFVLYPNHRAVQIAGIKNGIKVQDGYELEAFSFWTTSKSGYSCQVHIVDPRIKYDPATLGHEVTHCIFGEFHPSRNPK